jgi:hypothetical protein
MSAFGVCPSIRSVDLSSDALRILFGTKGCEIYEVSAADGYAPLIWHSQH